MTAPTVTREGYAFAGWTPDVPATMPAENTAYAANWTPISYTVRFDANGGDGSMPDQTFTYDVAQNLRGNTFARTGYNYAGWSGSAGGAVLYADGASVSNLTATAGDTVTLYAVWNKTAWRELQDQFDAGGTVTLAADVDATAVDDSLLVTNAVVLDLAGHTLADHGIGYAITVDNGGVLTLTNSVPDAGAVVGTRYGTGVYVKQGGAFTMDGGAITGDGTGVLVGYAGAAFTMNGGAITNNGESGVSVYAGSFTMNGGRIADNETESDGGGVYVFGHGSFALNGGEISGNSAEDEGGGAYICAGCTMTVSGSPVVSGNTLSAGAANNVYLEDGATIAVGALAADASIGVTTAIAPSDGHPVVFTSGAATDDAPYFFSDDDGCFVGMTNGELCLATAPTSPWAWLQCRLDEGGTVTLTNDVAAAAGDAYLTVTNPVTLDLAGHTLRHNGNKEAIHVTTGGVLTLTNGVEGAGAVTGGGDHGVYVGSNAVFRLQAGAISGNFTGYGGGGVFVNEYGAFEMTGGAIADNIATNHAGGGVFVYKGSFTMSGGTISGNPAGFGGGVFVGDGAIFTMNGGTIADNSASGGDGGGGARLNGGGGVYVALGGSFAMNGGAVSGNSADADGGGVEVSFGGAFSVSGSPVVSGNATKQGVPSNVRLPPEGAMRIGGLSAGASIGVTTYEGPNALRPVVVATGAAAGDDRYFFSDFSPYLVAEAGGEIRLEVPDSPWGALQRRLAEGGTVALTNDVAALDYERALQITNAVTLDLNGHTLVGSAKSEAVLLVDSDGRLLLTNSVPASGSVTGGGGVEVSFGGEFLMAGGTIAGCGAGDGCGAGVYVSFGGSFTMTGGTIRGNAAERGAGVYVFQYGSFTMNGGEISGNSSERGGGVYVERNCTFAMNGGSISGNVAGSSSSSWGDALGGGVYLAGGGSYEDNGTYTMSGGTICSNVAECGGGVYVGQRGLFSIGGGEISGNSADEDGGGVYSDELVALSMSGGTISGNSAYNGGGVYVYYGGVLRLNGGAISGNSAEYGGGVSVNDSGILTVSGSPVVSGNANKIGLADNVYLRDGETIAIEGLETGASIGVSTERWPEDSGAVAFAAGAAAGDAVHFFSDAGFDVGQDGDALVLAMPSTTPWKDLQARLDAGGTVALAADVAALAIDEPLWIQSEVVLDLAGHTLTGLAGERVVNIGANGFLTLTNSVPGRGAITGGSTRDGGGVFVFEGGVFTMDGGAITGCVAEASGGGVCVDDGGSFEMNGGAISGNFAGNGGGVFVNMCGSFEMNGGEIAGNRAEQPQSDDLGGGVYVRDGGSFEMNGGAISGNSACEGGGVYVDEDGSFEMTGGAVSGNAAESGGGVYVDECGDFAMAGGAVSGNAADSGGGVYVEEYGRMDVSGSPVIAGNTNAVGAANNVSLTSDRPIYVDELEAGASIGVTARVAPVPDSPVAVAYGAGTGGRRFFSSDDPDFLLAEDPEYGVVFLRVALDSPWEALQRRLDAGGLVTLAEDVVAVDGDDPLLVAGAVALDLNGHTLAFNGNGSVFEIASGGNLVLTNGVPATGAVTGGADERGGGVTVLDGGAFTMDGGAITGCVAAVGAGVFVDEGGSFAMNGGRITENAAYWSGGGVAVFLDGMMAVSGSPVISGNTTVSGEASNVILYDGVRIAVGGLSEGASIGMTPGERPTVFEPVVFTAGAAAGDIAFFSSDISEIPIEERDGELCFAALDTPWTALQIRLLGGGVVALTNDVAATLYDGPLVVTNAVVLDLAGHSLFGPLNERAIYIDDGGRFTLTNSVPDTGAITGPSVSFPGGGGIGGEDPIGTQGGGDTISTRGGEDPIGGGDPGLIISPVGEGSGVYVADGGVFTMDGGAIAGCTAGDGGGVYVAYGGAFTMNAGLIVENTAGDGGGVYVDANAAFTVSGAAVIADNVDFDDEANNVYLCEGAAIAVAGLSEGAAIGVSIDAGTARLAPVAVTDGAAAGDIERFSSDDPGLALTLLANGEIGLRVPLTWALLQEMLYEGGAITLTDDCAASPDDRFLSVTTTVVLDLAGHTIMGNGRDHVFYVYDCGDLTLTNSAATGGAITGGGDVYSGGGVFVDGGAFTMDGGAITGCVANMYGGGVYVPDGTFTMNGGEIRDNAANHGGGVYVGVGTFTMNGGTIAGNTATNGAGVCGAFTMNGGEIRGNAAEEGGGGVYTWNRAFTMNGGTIAGNTATGGGGVRGPLAMNGGTITGNSALSSGGGVTAFMEEVVVSGSAVIAGNTNSLGGAANVYLIETTLAVGDLAPGASIGVRTYGVPAEGSPVAFATGSSAGDAAYFFSDVATNHVEFADGKLWLAQGVAYPAYLDGADDAVKANWVAWAGRYGANADAAYEGHFLLDIDPRMEIPDGAAPLKIVDFRLTATSLYIEVASDVTEFEEKGNGTAIPTVGNGYLTFRIAMSPSPNPADWMTLGRLPVEIRNGHAIYSAFAESGSGSGTGSISGGGSGSGSMMPPAMFIKAAITVGDSPNP